MKKLFAVSAAALLALGLAACDGGEKEPTGEGKTITLQYSGTASNQEFNEGLFEDFKAWRKAEGDNNTYVIEYLAIGPDKVDSEVLDWTIGPDVYEFASDKITGLYQKGALAKLTTKQAATVKAENSDLGVDLATFNGSLYAYPYTGDNTYYLQYDKSKLTAEDVKTVEGILKKCEENGWKFGYNLPEAFWGAAALFTFGADYSMEFDEDGSVKNVTADFDGANGIKAINAIKKIMDSSAWTKESAAPTEANKLAGCIAGTWDITSYKDVLGENYACAVMPTVTIDGETKHLGAFLGGKLFGVNPLRSGTDTDRLAAAHLLAQFLSNEESQLKRFENQQVAPCNKKAAATEKVTSNENVKVLVEHATYSHAQTAVPGNFWSAPATLVNGIDDGSIATAEQITAAAKTLNDSIKASK